MDKKKALIITYYWPPAGGPGVQRWLKFVKYLPDFNIVPSVYTPENPSYPLVDNGLLNEVSESLVVLKQPIREPYKLASIFSKQKAKTISKGIISENKKQSFLEKAMLFIRGNFFIPDARISWVKPSVVYLSKYIQNENIETIITTGPPHSLHLIGMKLKEKCAVKWLADFRDPWTTIGYHKQLKLTKAAQKKHKTLEAAVLNKADQIVVTSNVTKNEFRNITERPISVITNGYDYESVEQVPLDVKFSMAHIGSLLSKRNPEVLWRVLRDLIMENEDFSNDFQLNLVGAVSEDVLKSIYKNNLKAHLHTVDYVSHAEAIQFQRKSQVLLLIEIDSEDTKCIIPGKLFEYMVSNRPIIAVGPEGSDVETIITETNTGFYFNYNEYKSLKSTILTYYKAFQNQSLQSFPIGLQKYSRKSLTKSLSKLI
ncbi:glycosyl transferase family 1 [Pseudalgibacter alginicilyticus]|uniref:Glycosyl transferase family 1 n=1 Tax=Pseudalgibacter alginicilyticus TaxID=1736674 RepID=A0A0P0CQ75_9FLAO|nr:glycosyltransferase family 4 protein [Pseudalgibacter alginicilyticus]ALJ06583.1 glycosyl transferase family 1 [Pseudalgibacter alginicilyticus]